MYKYLHFHFSTTDGVHLHLRFGQFEGHRNAEGGKQHGNGGDVDFRAWLNTKNRVPSGQEQQQQYRQCHPIQDAEFMFYPKSGNGGHVKGGLSVPKIRFFAPKAFFFFFFFGP